jgi:hypothetical protein
MTLLTLPCAALILQGQDDCTKILNLDAGFHWVPIHADITGKGLNPLGAQVQPESS